MTKNIQDLRREAGYRSARDFAAALGIAASTYARYEGQPDAIPLRQAWAIADFLGCSIDMVVGREPVSVADMRGDVQKFYDGISDEGRRLMDDHMDYVAHRERKARERERAVEHERNIALMRGFVARFERSAAGASPFGIVVEYDSSPAGRRAAFERYLREQASAKLDADIDACLEGLDGEGLEDERQALTIEYEARDREVIDGIMSAYDEDVASHAREWTSFLSDPK